MIKKFMCAFALIVFGVFAANNSAAITKVTETKTVEVQTVKPTELQKMLADGTVELIDVRSTDEFIEKHIKGAKNVPLPILDSSQINISGKKIVTQCKSGKRGKEAYLLLKKQNPSMDIANLEGGIEAWEKEKLEIVSISNKLPIMRQVQIIAGSLVTVGTALGIVGSSAFFIVPIFVGCGLAIAGISGWCGMAKLLSYMPWN